MRPPSEDDPLPEYQGPARVTLLVIDPYLLHAYWELDPKTLPEASHAVLRIHDTTGEASSYFDLPVSLPAKNWYVHLWTPERTYYAELGLSEEGGGFTLLARSNMIQTPRCAAVAAVPETLESESQEDSVRAVEPVSQTCAPLPLPLVTAQQRDSVLQPESVLQLDSVLQPDSVSPSYDHPGVVPQPPGIPAPVDAAKLLRTRLEAIYALLEWTPRAGELAESPAPVMKPNPIEPGDLTQLAEEHFTAGVSSKSSNR